MHAILWDSELKLKFFFVGDMEKVILYALQMKTFHKSADRARQSWVTHKITPISSDHGHRDSNTFWLVCLVTSHGTDHFSHKGQAKIVISLGYEVVPGTGTPFICLIQTQLTPEASRQDGPRLPTLGLREHLSYQLWTWLTHTWSLKRELWPFTVFGCVCKHVHVLS